MCAAHCSWIVYVLNGLGLCFCKSFEQILTIYLECKNVGNFIPKTLKSNDHTYLAQSNYFYDLPTASTPGLKTGTVQSLELMKGTEYALTKCKAYQVLLK